VIGALILKLGAGRGWDALNRRDLHYFERYLADDVVCEIPGAPPIGGRFVGKVAWLEAMQRWVDAVPSYHYRVIHTAVANPLALGLTNTVITEYELTERMPDGRTHRGLGIDVTEMKRGKIVAERTYSFDPAAEEAFLGMPAAPTGAEAGSVSA
jgi:ketosteroid isomerase-like protein